MNVTVHGDTPKPWVIVYGIDEHGEPADQIRRMVPKSRFASTPADLWTIRQAEYDAAIIFEPIPNINLDKDLYVLQFDEGTPQYVRAAHNGLVWRLIQSDGQNAERFTTDQAAVDDDVAPLAAAMLPSAGQPYRALKWHLEQQELHSQRVDPPPVDSFVSEFNGLPIAGRLARSPEAGSAELWWLPGSAKPKAIEWIAAAFRRWARIRPELFPGFAEEWSTHQRWMTAAEYSAKQAVDRYRTEMLEELRRREAELTRLEAVFAETSAAADAAERQLLTAQGTPLVDEVAAALRDIGLNVIDADALPKRKGDKLEDLRVVDEGWTALVEVKGYGGRKTARTTDISQLGRAVERFILAEHREPDARWYVVNQMAGSDPANRPRPLASQPDDVEVFAAAGGLVIDTTDLYQLREAFRRGELDGDTARALLRGSKGIFNYDPNRSLE